MVLHDKDTNTPAYNLEGCNTTEWEPTSGWTYAGHGEWITPEEHTQTNEKKTVEWEPGWIQNWWTKVDEDIALHQQVLDKGYPNRWGA